jgi:uncharacterized protein YidB (DUF937 family)
LEVAMGLLDTVIGAINGASSNDATGAHPDLLHAALGMLSNDSPGGGLQGLIQKFEQGGLADVVSSWVGTGNNLPISADQLQSVLGSDAISSLASKLGLSGADVSQQLSQILPKVVDQLTPNGAAPEGGLGDLGSLIGQFLKPGGGLTTS